MNNLLKQALKGIKPTKVEERQLLKIANLIIKKIKIKNAKPVLGGSLAKGTWLKNSHDIDIYVKFRKQFYANKNISEILYTHLKTLFKNVEVLHGSRDYFHVKHGKFVIEIVPIIDIKKAEDALNITDVSPLHVKWVQRHKHKVDEIRLVKAFCKANRVYGAESYIKGFSGYVLEIMTISYGSFLGLIESVAKWNIHGKMIIDVEDYYKGKNIMQELNVSKLYSPLIVIDPVQANRNAAAGLGLECYKKLINLALKFLAKPSLTFFKQKRITLPSLKKQAKNNQLVVIEALPLKGKKDIIGAKLLKCFEYLKKQLILNNFYLLDSGWEFNRKALFWFILKNEILPAYKKHYGPPYINKKAVNSFKKKWHNKDIEIEKGRLFVMLKRRFRKPEQLIKSLLKSDYVKSRIDKVFLKVC